MTDLIDDKEESFEQSLKKLDKLLNDIENKKIENLDEFINSYEYGATLIEKCEKKLNDATLRIKKISERILNNKDS